MNFEKLLQRMKAWLLEKPPVGWDHQTESPIYEDPDGPGARADRELRLRARPSQEIELPALESEADVSGSATRTRPAFRTPSTHDG